jgi:hypothetical protein
VQHGFVRLLLLLLCSAFASSGLAREQAPGAAVYPLDELSRAVVVGVKLPCETGQLALVSYRGELLRYQKPLRIHPAFRAQLVAFESIVDEVARAHFGRAPRHIQHFGAYACRPMRNHAHWASEHAFGNAIDVAGFEFGPLPRKSPAFATLPRALRRTFQVRVDKHWEGASALQAAFLKELAERIIARPDVFRAVVGPGWPGHDNHFHLAHPPYRMVKLGETQRWFW